MTAHRLPFVFIHGAGGTRSKWRRTRERLHEDDALYVDLPSHGSNTALPEKSIERYAQVLDHQLDRDFIAVGHSMGGLIGIELAARNPHVKGLVLVASHYNLPVHEKILAKLATGEFPNSLFYASYGKQSSPALLEEERAQIALVDTETCFLDFDACNRYGSGQSAIAGLSIPVLGLYGAEDRLLPSTAMEDLLKTGGNVSQVVIENAGHYVMLEQPDEVVRALMNFRQNLG